MQLTFNQWQAHLSKKLAKSYRKLGLIKPAKLRSNENVNRRVYQAKS